ncbi:xyloside xylosyltransferase 1 isoform X4 [Tamandua tetradactyla]|uniref:xyloside xylosyltransferase 1 isoform X4 n=1 Tax=Tamandua tetradactyla TaxID=48850 RepID=UPI0040548477
MALKETVHQRTAGDQGGGILTFSPPSPLPLSVAGCAHPALNPRPGCGVGHPAGGEVCPSRLFREEKTPLCLCFRENQAVSCEVPHEILQIIQLDLDLKFKTNIRELFEEFDNFLPSAVIGIAREMQPVYRQQESASTRLLSPVPLSCLKGAAHLCSYLGSELSWRDGLNMIKMHTFWQFRHENPKTRVGSPPPEGLPGFNSGVMLLNLEAMRHSPLYSRLLEPAQVQQLANKYHFRGHLGDQDFFTMIGMEHPELFHVLDCTWNRQLCTWWRDHGYSDVFQAYFRCEGHVKIYHGNCNTPIPED